VYPWDMLAWLGNGRPPDEAYVDKRACEALSLVVAISGTGFLGLG
jgi:hypothetical protein